MITSTTKAPRAARRLTTAVTTTNEPIDITAWAASYARVVYSLDRARQAEAERRALPEAS